MMEEDAAAVTLSFTNFEAVSGSRSTILGLVLNTPPTSCVHPERVDEFERMAKYRPWLS